MPGTKNEYFASAGLDKQVRHTHVETNRSDLWRCHEKSVKTVSPLDTHTFVSASRDGTVRLFDVRAPTSVAPPVIVRMPVGLSRQLAFNSAIPSPVCSHHLLVSANEPYVRVFDLRMSPPPEIVSAKGYAIESYCPPHLHPSAPEQSTYTGFRGILATYANFSPDGKHIVATYYEDAISVFDRPFQDGRHITLNPSVNGSIGNHLFRKSPFSSRRHCLMAVAKFLNDATLMLKENKHDLALAAANHVLSLDERNLFALLCKAYALQKREKQSDFRVAYCTLQKLLDIVNEDNTGEAIAYLWTSWSDIFSHHGIRLSPVGMSASKSEIGFQHSFGYNNGRPKPTWCEMRDIWIAIFEYMQAFNLSRMIPSVYFTMLHTSRSKERVLTMKRLEYLDSMCAKLEAYRNKASPVHATHPGRWAVYVRRALGSPEDRNVLYPGSNGSIRRHVLSELVESFLIGLDKLRKVLTDTIGCLRPDDRSRTRDSPGAGNTLEAPITLGSGHTLVYIVQQQPLRRRRRQQQQEQQPSQHQLQQAGGNEAGTADEDNNENELIEQDEHDDNERDHMEYIEEYGDFDEDDGIISSDSEYDMGISEAHYQAAIPNSSQSSDADKGTSSSSGATIESDETALWKGLTETTGYRSFLGHTSKQTDIKEANFFGSSNQIILSGSDDGKIYMWNAMTGELLNHTVADEQIVNCVLGHPHHMMILASGIDESIKMLTP